MEIPSLDQQLNLEAPVPMKLRQSTPNGKYIEVQPLGGQGVFRHGRPNAMGSSYSFTLPAGDNFAIDTTKSAVVMQFDLQLQDTVANVIAGTSIFGKVYSLDRTCWSASSYEIGATDMATASYTTKGSAVNNPKLFKKTWLNPGPETAFSVIDNASVQIAGSTENVPQIYRKGACLMENLTQGVCKCNFPQTFFDYMDAIQMDTRYYNYITVNDGTANQIIRKVLAQTTVPAVGANSGNLTDSAIAATVWQMLADPLPTLVPCVDVLTTGLLHRAAGWNVYTAATGAEAWGVAWAGTEILTFTQQVTFRIPLNLLFTSFADQTFYAQCFPNQNQMQLNLNFQPYNFCDIFGGRLFVDYLAATDDECFVLRNNSDNAGAPADVTIAGAGFLQNVGNIGGALALTGTGLTRLTVQLYKIDMIQDSPEIRNLPIIQRPVVAHETNIITVDGWQNMVTQRKISTPHESVNRLKIAFQIRDNGFAGLTNYTIGTNAHTSNWQSGRRSWIPFNAIPTILNMSGEKQRAALIWMFQFNLQYAGVDIFGITNGASSIDFLACVNDNAINAQNNYNIPGNMDELLWQAINYGGGVDVNFTQFQGIGNIPLANDGINTKNQELSFTNQPAVYGNTAGVFNDNTITYPLTISNLEYYMPRLTTNVCYEWHVYYQTFQKYFPQNNQFALSEEITQTM